MIIFPTGLYSGERLAQCSDLARLHFPYIVGLVNGFGRLELNVPAILGRAYEGFQDKPTKHDLTAWISEYRDQHLLYVYVSADGSVWGQFCGIPPNALPRYQTAADKRSPAPDNAAIEAFNEEYLAKKRKRSEACEDFMNLSEHFGNLPKASEVCGTFPMVVGSRSLVVGEEQKQILSSPSVPVPDPPVPSEKRLPARDQEAEAIVEHVFAYYLRGLGRSEKQYELTPKRMKKGLAALAECRSRFPDGTKAEEAMGSAVDGLLANDWNMGRHPNNKKRYVDWIDHLFKDVETMEARWEDGGFKVDV